jgi:hypothetical protein
MIVDEILVVLEILGPIHPGLSTFDIRCVNREEAFVLFVEGLLLIRITKGFLQIKDILATHQ